MSKEEIKITKLDAAKRQLNAAIYLWFHDQDPVSIHTLAYASHEIIHRLYRRKGLKGLFFDNDVVGRLGIIKTIKEWPNFFKHANQGDDDPEASVNFRPEANLIFFSACISGLNAIGEKGTDLEHAIGYWLLLHYPDYFDFENPKLTPAYPKGKTFDLMRAVDKKKFLDIYLEFVAAKRRKRRRKQIGT